MLKHWFGMALALSAASMPVWAGDTASSSIRPLLGIGYTWGGDTIAQVELKPVSGNSASQYEDLSGGAGLDLRTGASWHFSDKARLQAMVAFHNDSANGLSGQMSFRRVPIELLIHWQASDNWWVGGGLRRAFSGKYDRQAGFTRDIEVNGEIQTVTLGAYKESAKFSTALVVEAEYMLSKNWGAKFRAVKESAKFELDTEKFNADHIGAIVTYNFD